ncbi:CMP-2-keto-3-deoxyoctulosonic acid synthetase [Parvibacter caecicola]|uniref:CMP-2-keto-3-deoxyoctulosonic acid synthetase n=1 Tax=Parvibacter caecicola TaxID=747645 RepID=UPI001B7FA302|nr:CMP-2-keto-3-deoxyoctulosonic acid synthetase [Parvibacter caecicola]
MVSRTQHRTPLALRLFAVVVALVLAAVGLSTFIGFAGAANTQGAGFFGIDETSGSFEMQEASSNATMAVASESSPEVIVRDMSAGYEEIAQEEEAARIAAEEAAAAAEAEAIQRANDARSKYLNQFGSLPAGDVDFSIGRDAFIEEWGSRIDDYLSGTTLAGYGETFAAAAWEYGVDPRWSPAISNTESGNGKVCFLPHNAWGWGSSSWGNWTDAIYSHVRGLANGYGFTISYSFAGKYCPPFTDHWYNNTLSQMKLI